jgi:hypothetical protein
LIYKDIGVFENLTGHDFESSASTNSTTGAQRAQLICGSRISPDNTYISKFCKRLLTIAFNEQISLSPSA